MFAPFVPHLLKSNLACPRLPCVLCQQPAAMAQTGQPPSNASAEQPGQLHIALDLLNKASAKTGGTWDVYLSHVFEDKYEYKWQGKTRQGNNIVCTLVSAEDPQNYCQAQFKKTAQSGLRYEKALKAYKQGARYIMSKVAFVEEAKAAYVSCPIKHVVDLSKTNMDECVGASNSAVQPAPTATVAGGSNLGSNQFFDVTALIQEVHETRQHENNRSSFGVRIHDGSLDTDTKKIKAIQLTIFYDTVPSGSAAQPVAGVLMKAVAEEHLQNKTAVSFFCISGSQNNQGLFSFRSTKNTFLSKAVGAKADKLNGDAALHNLQVTDTVAFDLQTAKAARDWSIEPGKETRCKLLATIARTATGVPELDNGETLWQCNWVQISEPSEGQNIKSNDGARLWFPLTLRDDSGSILLFITEQAAVKLANVVDAAEFEQLHAEKRLRLPFWASVKVCRRPRKSSAAQPGTSCSSDTQPDHNDFDCFIVDAAEQNIHEQHSSLSTLLLPMLSQSVDSILPARLEMVRNSEHYTMAVQYMSQQVPQELCNVAAINVCAGSPMLRPCSGAVALVLSTKRSTPIVVGTGHKRVTDDVVDLLTADGDEYSCSKAGMIRMTILMYMRIHRYSLAVRTGLR